MNSKSMKTWELDGRPFRNWSQGRAKGSLRDSFLIFFLVI